jgi:ArsR family transcriptional regulator
MTKQIKIFKALSDKNRLRILMMLSNKPLCVCEIQFILKVTVSTVSKHLSMLRDVGFITDEKIGKWVYYKLNKTTKDPLVQQFLMSLPMWLCDDEIVNSDFEKALHADKNLVCK